MFQNGSVNETPNAFLFGNIYMYRACLSAALNYGRNRILGVVVIHVSNDDY